MPLPSAPAPNQRSSASAAGGEFMENLAVGVGMVSGEGSSHDLNPLVWRREAWGVGRGGVERGEPPFPGARKWVALPLSARIRRPDGGKTP